MAFNGLEPSSGPYVLGSDSPPVHIWVKPNISNGLGADEGAQWIMADPIGPGKLKVSDFVKEKRIVVPDQLEVLYWVTVTNIGLDDSIFTVQGGGNV